MSWVADSFKYFVVSGLNDIQYNVTVVVLGVLTSTDTGKNSKKLVKKLRENCKMIQKIRYNPGYGITITGD